MKVTLFQRRPNEAQFSLESYFSRVVVKFAELGLSHEVTLAPAISRGIVARIKILICAAFLPGDLVHVTGDITFSVLAMRHQRTIVTFLDCEILARTSGWRRLIIRKLWFDLPTRRAAAITVISNATKVDLIENVPQIDAQKIHVIPVSVSESFRADPRPMRDSAVRILQVGTKSNKNIFRVVSALKGVPCTLIIVGPVSAPLSEHLRECDVDYEQYSGLTEEQLVELYRDCDLVTFVSTHEGFGMPILEAQGMGRPVLTSDCSSMPEVAGRGAHFVDPFSVSSIRDGILKVANDSKYRAEIVQLGYENVSKYDTGTIAKQYQRLYEEVWQAI